MSKIYLICPVRGAAPAEQAALGAYVAKLEAGGDEVHYPPRDTNQADDGCGLNICESHLQALRDADEVHAWWNPTSTGSHFDFGMAFALHGIRPRRFVLAGPPGTEPTEQKSFLNAFLRLVSLWGTYPWT